MTKRSWNQHFFTSLHVKCLKRLIDNENSRQPYFLLIDWLASKLHRYQSNRDFVGYGGRSSIHECLTGLLESVVSGEDTPGNSKRSYGYASTGQSQIQSTVGPPWIWLVPAHSMDDWLDWGLGNCEARLMPWAPCHVPWGIPEQVLQHVRLHCPAHGVCLVFNGSWVGYACQLALAWILGT